MISVGDDAVLLGAGVVAGAVGSAGGITSLISYPALLAVGISPLPAAVTNIVAIVACWPGSALASRPELQGRVPWLKRWSLVAVAGGAAGATLLLVTPAGVFAKVVPFLIAFASVALLLQPRISAWQERRHGGAHRLLLPCGLLLVCVYNGYFGAGAGVMVLVLMLLTVDQHLATANALKNMLLGVATLLSALAFVIFGHVNWGAAPPLAVGLFAGSTVGPWVARRVPGSVLRWLVSLAGLGLAVHLWLAA
ncbi:MAG: sulfite exporter TauE/SafE family protein [Acidimicrobiales bacterium]